jgi:hypothetical protein
MMTDVSEEHTTSIIALMMKAVHTSDTSVNTNLTIWRYIPEDSINKFAKGNKTDVQT